MNQTLAQLLGDLPDQDDATAPPQVQPLALIQTIDRTAPRNPTATPSNILFDPRLAFELALEQEPVDNVRRRFAIGDNEWQKLITNPSLSLQINKYKEALKGNGADFRMKCKVHAEASLDVVWNMIVDARTPPPVRADLMKWLGKMGDLEPKTDRVGEGSGRVFNLQINL